MIEAPLALNFLVKLSLASIFGCVVGYERQSRRKPAGIKTHALICLGACAMTFLSKNFSIYGDPSRIAAQIVSGIGFIGAGTIFIAQHRVQGLTSAATVWASASVGMLVGSGYELLGLITVGIIGVLFFCFHNLRIGSGCEYQVSISIKDEEGLNRIYHLSKTYGLKVFQESISKEKLITYRFRFVGSPLLYRIYAKRLRSVPGISSLSIQS